MRKLFCVVIMVLLLGLATAPNVAAVNFFYCDLKWGAPPEYVLAFFDGFEPHKVSDDEGFELSYLADVGGQSMQSSFFFQDTDEPKLYKVMCRLISEDADVLRAFDRYYAELNQAFTETGGSAQICCMSRFLDEANAEDYHWLWRNNDTLADLRLIWPHDADSFAPILTLDFYDIANAKFDGRRAFWDSLTWQALVPQTMRSVHAYNQIYHDVIVGAWAGLCRPGFGAGAVFPRHTLGRVP